MSTLKSILREERYARLLRHAMATDSKQQVGLNLVIATSLNKRPDAIPVTLRRSHVYVDKRCVMVADKVHTLNFQAIGTSLWPSVTH